MFYLAPIFVLLDVVMNSKIEAHVANTAPAI
jgi:hypothetical protein